MKKEFLALTILALALFAGAAVTVEMLTLYPDSSLADRCAGSNCWLAEPQAHAVALAAVRNGQKDGAKLRR